MLRSPDAESLRDAASASLAEAEGGLQREAAEAGVPPVSFTPPTGPSQQGQQPQQGQQWGLPGLPGLPGGLPNIPGLRGFLKK